MAIAPCFDNPFSKPQIPAPSLLPSPLVKLVKKILIDIAFIAICTLIPIAFYPTTAMTLQAIKIASNSLLSSIFLRILGAGIKTVEKAFLVPSKPLCHVVSDIKEDLLSYRISQLGYRALQFLSSVCLMLSKCTRLILDTQATWQLARLTSSFQLILHELGHALSAKLFYVCSPQIHFDSLNHAYTYYSYQSLTSVGNWVGLLAANAITIAAGCGMMTLGISAFLCLGIYLYHQNYAHLAHLIDFSCYLGFFLQAVYITSAFLIDGENITYNDAYDLWTQHHIHPTVFLSGLTILFILPKLGYLIKEKGVNSLSLSQLILGPLEKRIQKLAACIA